MKNYGRIKSCRCHTPQDDVPAELWLAPHIQTLAQACRHDDLFARFISATGESQLIAVIDCLVQCNQPTAIFCGSVYDPNNGQAAMHVEGMVCHSPDHGKILGADGLFTLPAYARMKLVSTAGGGRRASHLAERSHCGLQMAMANPNGLVVTPSIVDATLV